MHLWQIAIVVEPDRGKEGVIVHVAKDAQIALPLQIAFVNNGQAHSSSHRVLVVVEEEHHHPHLFSQTEMLELEIPRQYHHHKEILVLLPVDSLLIHTE